MLAVAASPTDNAPEARAYLKLNFGGSRDLPRNFHYGLRLDRDSRYTQLPVALMQMDMSSSGTLDTQLNGMTLMRRSLIANQSEGGAEATAYTAADWGLIVLGAAGVGYAGYEVSKSDDEPTNGGGGSTTGGSTTGGSTTGGSTTGGSTTGLPLLGLAELDRLSNSERASSEYREWLDGGTGQMGDLEAR